MKLRVSFNLKRETLTCRIRRTTIIQKQTKKLLLWAKRILLEISQKTDLHSNLKGDKARYQDSNVVCGPLKERAKEKEYQRSSPDEW